jgi:hypothetical protein
MRGYPQWRWHLDEAFVKVNGKLCYLWRAVDHSRPCENSAAHEALPEYRGLRPRREEKI